MRRGLYLAVLSLVSLVATSPLCADTVFTISLASAGTASNSGQTSSLGTSQTIAANPGWSTALGSSSWISFANTGNPGASNYLQVANGTVVSFYDHFFMPGTATSGWVEVMADDSTSVILNGVTLVSEASTSNNYYLTCSDSGIGCRGGYKVDLPSDLLKTGDNVLEFRVAQRAGSSFGLDYYGEIVDPVSDVPEPASLALLVTGLPALGVLRRKKNL